MKTNDTIHAAQLFLVTLVFLASPGCTRTDPPPANSDADTPATSNAADQPPPKAPPSGAPEPRAARRSAPSDSADALPEPAPAQVLPDVDIQRVPVSVEFSEADALNDSTYRSDNAELELIKERLEPLLAKQVDVAEMSELNSLSLSAFNRVPYIRGTPTKDMPRTGTRPWYQLYYQAGRVRCVFKNQNGQRQLHRRVFYDDAGAPAVVCEHLFGKPFPNAVHYLQYDQRGYLARYLEFWSDANTGLRLRASYLVRAKDRYQNTIVYWFSEPGGEFQEKYVYTDTGQTVQTRKDNQPQPAGSRTYPDYINRPVQYDMKSIFPIPNE